MHFSSLSYRQWLLVSIGLAILFAGVAYVIEPDPGNLPGNSMSQLAFEEEIVRKMVRGDVTVQDLILHPPTASGEWLTGTEIRKTLKNGEQFVQFIPLKLHLSEPHSTAGAKLPKGKGFIPKLMVDSDIHNPIPIKSYLDKLHQVQPKVSFVYKYAWWEWQFRVIKSPFQLTLFHLPVCTVGPMWISIRVMSWFFGTILAFGFVFPLLSNLVTFGRVFPPTSDEKPKPSRAYRPAPKVKRAIAMTGMSQADMAQLQALEAAMEAKLKSTPSDRPAVSASATPTSAAPAIRPMISGEPAAEVPVAAANDEPKEFAGEFYPVAKPTTHKKG